MHIVWFKIGFVDTSVPVSQITAHRNHYIPASM